MDIAIAIAIVSHDALPAAIASWRPDAILNAHSPSRPMTAPWDGPWLAIIAHDTEAMEPIHGPMGRPWWKPTVPMARGMGRHGPRMGKNRQFMGNHGPSHGAITGMPMAPMAPPQPHHIEARQHVDRGRGR